MARGRSRAPYERLLGRGRLRTLATPSSLHRHEPRLPVAVDPQQDRSVLPLGLGPGACHIGGSGHGPVVGRDNDVSWQQPGLDPWVLDDAVILETKSGSTAGPLDRHLWAAGIRPSRISKFATGMAALRPDLPANRWNRTLSRSLPLRPAA